MDGAEEARGVVFSIYGRFGRSWASLRLIVAASTHRREVCKLRIEGRKMAKNPRDSRRENELVTGRHILIDIYKREYEMRGKIDNKSLKKG